MVAKMVAKKIDHYESKQGRSFKILVNKVRECSLIRKVRIL